MTFSPDSVEVSTGESFGVDIVVDTAGEKVGGVGVDILFNTNDLIAEKIETTSMFVDYPLASIDNDNGKVSISGVVASMNNLYIGKDVFAAVTFRAKSPGVGTVNFDFTPGDTTDSNIAVTYGTGDILSTTNYLTVYISGGSYEGDLSQIGRTGDGDSDIVSESNYLNEIFDKVTGYLKQFPILSDMVSFIESKLLKKNLGINEPISYSEPKTDPSQSQSVAQYEYKSQKTTEEKTMMGIIAVSTVFVIIMLFILIKKLRKPKIIDNVNI